MYDMADKNMIFLILAFLLIFMGFDTAQMYFSSVFSTEDIESISFISLSLIYVTLALSTLFAPNICRKLGNKKSLFLSSLFYPLFVISIIFRSELLIYISSVFLGVAASIIWTAQGVYITKITTDENRGFYSGLFFSLLPIGTFFMVLGISFIIEYINYTSIFLVLFLIMLLGSFSFLFLSDVKNTNVYKKTTLQTLYKKKMLLFVPFVVSSYYFAGFMLSVAQVRVADLFGLAAVGKIASVYMISLVIFPFLVGKLSDKYGIEKFSYISAISSIIGFAILYASESLLLIALGTVLVSYHFASCMALSYPIVSRLFGKELDSAMAARWMVSSIGVSIPLLSSLFLSFRDIVVLGAILSFVSLICLKYLFSIFMLKTKKR